MYIREYANTYVHCAYLLGAYTDPYHTVHTYHTYCMYDTMYSAYALRVDERWPKSFAKSADLTSSEIHVRDSIRDR